MGLRRLVVYVMNNGPGSPGTLNALWGRYSGDPSAENAVGGFVSKLKTKVKVFYFQASSTLAFVVLPHYDTSPPKQLRWRPVNIGLFGPMAQYHVWYHSVAHCQRSLALTLSVFATRDVLKVYCKRAKITFPYEQRVVLSETWIEGRHKSLKDNRDNSETPSQTSITRMNGLTR